MPTLGAYVRRRRIELGLTQEQLAEQIGDGVRQADISRLENDRVVLPRRDRLERIADALDVPLGHLLVRSGWTGADDLPMPEMAVSAPDVPSVPPAGSPPNVVEVLEQIKALVEQVETLIDESATPVPAPQDDPSTSDPPASSSPSPSAMPTSGSPD